MRHPRRNARDTLPIRLVDKFFLLTKLEGKLFPEEGVI
jgi:hypothetical protein